jgi:hypothetical protein
VPTKAIIHTHTLEVHTVGIGRLRSLYKKQGKWRQAIEAYTIAVNCLEGTRNGKRNAAPYHSMLAEVYLANGYKLEGLKNLDKSKEFFEFSAKTETGQDLRQTLECLEKIAEMRAEAQRAQVKKPRVEEYP